MSNNYPTKRQEMSDNSGELREVMRVSNDYFQPTTNYQHLLPPQYFAQHRYYPYVNPYSHLTEANGNLTIHGYGSDGRPKFRRSRTIFNPEQLDILEKHFKKYKYPDLKRRKTISEEIGLPEERTQIWFQNRRAKDKRQLEQQEKFQKLVDEAIGGTQDRNRIQSNNECGTSFHSPVEHLNQLSQHETQAHFDSEASDSNHNHVEYVQSKEMIFPESTRQKTAEGTSQSGSGSEETPQDTIQNIDQELLFKVANILSASNDAAQLITEWSQSPNKLQTNSLEEQLQHFAQHHQKVLKDSENAPSGSISQSGLDRSQ
ncbi:paired box Pax-6 isoform X1 [Paramuricea clavata]|uniref:Paired box Pax-6 isoform X1 n=1 Tax=Paramuricea clavata TaxID=317549 RepID=A0A7D9DQF9_PARCT|nr:paired box Pax-6 isoform X1 [Paramuricea clavata]